MKKENIIIGSTHITGLLLVLFFVSTQFFGCGGDEPEQKEQPVQKEVVKQQETKKPEPKPVPEEEERVIRGSRNHPGLDPNFRGEVYVVKPGDNLNDLARYYYGKWEHWRDIFHANEGRIDDWNVLMPGLRLEIPPLMKDAK